ncbi:hypothetical protein WJ92_02765 [Burkholderia ubonensis]|uniref:hypothetical protein n=1 Tax=Burkholderia ubonensis TaxID=101571 RepID=UPI00075D7B1A|nr:hypothetical protein [Burkholderia ubonensis]KVP77518.1 hypothetical protein WJ92_02765 [Burkholderia ubonensis]KVT65676.1 hypothetical protein WK55_31500 [Burkholderia ubonensis]
MNELQVKLMRRTALARRKDAQTLRDADPFGNRSDSEYMLDLLALELLIKCLLHANDVQLEKVHSYNGLFAKLPKQTQDEVLAKAIEITGPSQLTIDHFGLLDRWGKQFVELRYPHEKYSDLSTEAEYVELGIAWERDGADPDSATFRYYPEELRAFLMALEQVTEQYDV